MEKLLEVRYPLYAGKLAWFRMTSELRPNFDRQGNEIRSVRYWASCLCRLGSDGPKAALVRWAVIAFLVVVAKKYAELRDLLSYLR